MKKIPYKPTKFVETKFVETKPIEIKYNKNLFPNNEISLRGIFELKKIQGAIPERTKFQIFYLKNK